MNNAPEVGKLIEGPAFRDAIHVAIAPVIAAFKLHANDDVGIDKNGEATTAGPHIGKVDPFLKTPVMKGEGFWLFLYPNTVTSLRHAWTHPSFKPKVPTND